VDGPSASAKLLAAIHAAIAGLPDFDPVLMRLLRDEVQKQQGDSGRKQSDLAKRLATANGHARRLAKRLYQYGDELLTFVECEGVPADHHHAEREVRPAVMMRKVSQGNRRERGAYTRAVRMTVYRTLKKRGLEPLQVALDALRS
jgi:hypothetical protein